MATDSPIDIRQLAMPHTGMDLVSLVWDKGSPWVEDIYRRSRGEYGDSADHFFVALADGQMVAIAWYCTATSNPKLGLIGHIYTSPPFRGRGISRRLIDAAMSDFRDGGGEVIQLFSSTPYTIPFYERLGFENLYANRGYHDTDWYMRYPKGSRREIDGWFACAATEIQPLSAGDLSGYCLLYNLEHDSVSKDWAQSIGLGMEAEFTFIHSMAKVSRGEAVCCILKTESAIVGIASLVRQDFPHQSHIANLDLYVHPNFLADAQRLVDACLDQRERVGAEIVYALGVDPPKREMLGRLGFCSRVLLTRHYKVASRYFDSELFISATGP